MAIGLAGLSASGVVDTALATPGTVHFTAAGDYGTESNTRSVLGKIGSIDPDLNLALGDLAYGAVGTEPAWCDLVTQYVGAGFPFELISGNHESDGINGNINDFSACLPNQLPGAIGTYGRQWYVDVPAQNPLVRFVLISPGLTYPDGTYDYPAGSPRYAWTAAAIDGARAAAIPWVVVGMHKPCLSTGLYACESGADLLNLLLAKRVDLVLSGHEHEYERTKQLALAPGCPSLTPGAAADLDCIADSRADVAKGAGTVFVTAGTGGVAQRDRNLADPEAPYFAAGSGLSTATWGVLDVQATATTLTASFERAAGGSFTDAFSIGSVGPPSNLPPTAAFTSSCTLLDCTLDGSGSSDADGTVTSYTWSFGDGASDTGASATHSYAAAGTYPVILTVTDDAGATGSVTHTVTVSSSTVVASDSFERTVASGFGSADVGGVWTTSGAASVSSGTGRLTLASQSSLSQARLTAVTGTALTTQVTESWDKRPNGSGGWFLLRGRVTTGGEYRLKVGHKATGAVTARLVRTNAAGAETGITAETTVPGLTYTAGTAITTLFEVSGTSPTTLRAKVWATTGTQPSAWLISTTDATTALQVTGHTGLAALNSSTTTNGPVTVRVDNYTVTGP
ncbi:PKD domain-containing protein [Pengzhenrongella sp.]|uniref:PKD domain-containing protein n=1 Tax=Pengzhenrongella sp. TaxID=2888820 RepID=UPI002F957E99